jgi:hypothetical protein
MYDGSGTSLAHALAGPAGLRDSSTPNGANPDLVVPGVLNITTNLIISDFLGPSAASLGFGFAYEILRLVDGPRFEYVDNILYFAITHELDESGHFLRSDFCGSFYKYKASGNYTIVYVYDPSNKNQHIHIVTPIGRQSKQTEDDLLRRFDDPDYCFPFGSEYYCAFVRFKAPDFVSPPVVMVFPSDGAQSDHPIDISEKNVISLRVAPHMVEWMYKAIREDQNGRGDV